MTNAPEKILAWHEVDNCGHHKFWISNPEKRTGDETPYIREDVAQAMVAEAVKASADRVRSHRAHLNFEAMLQLLRDDPLPEPIVKAVSNLLDGIANGIDERVPDDAIAALEQVKREARNEAIKEASREVTSMASRMITTDMKEMLSIASKRIMALTKE
jgi:hypothetical protein